MCTRYLKKHLSIFSNFKSNYYKFYYTCSRLFTYHLSNTEAVSEVVIGGVVVADVDLVQEHLESWQLKGGGVSNRGWGSSNRGGVEPSIMNCYLKGWQRVNSPRCRNSRPASGLQTSAVISRAFHCPPTEDNSV